MDGIKVSVIFDQKTDSVYRIVYRKALPDEYFYSFNNNRSVFPRRDFHQGRFSIALIPTDNSNVELIEFDVRFMRLNPFVWISAAYRAEFRLQERSSPAGTAAM